MKKIFLLIFLFFIYNYFYAFADNNFENEYTLIDCINWNNDTWVAFDSTKPYATLKQWIESTINYINKNVNYVWNENTASWKIFNIKVDCSFNDILNTSINLNFLWEKFNNELIIEWNNEKSLVFKNINFNLSTNAWNITFKNASFLNEDKPYFFDDLLNNNKHNKTIPFSYWIKIIDSYIKLKNNNIWLLWTYKIERYVNRNWNIDYNYFQNYTNKQIIENSVIDIEILQDFDFRLPTYIKNSKITFTSSWSNILNNIKFLEEGNINIHKDLNYSILSSNIIDLWWNNLNIENTENITFLNNKIVNFENIVLWWNWIYINNYFENNNILDLSNIKNLYNNLFKTNFTDNFDVNNYRKNFHESNIWSNWIWWVYKRLRDNKYLSIDINSSWLYREMTWQDLQWWLWEIFVIFNY